MSLIDDALKRAQAAGQPDVAGAPAERPWVPTPLPDAGPARRRRLARILAATLGIVVTAGAGVWLLRRTPEEGAPLPSRKAPVPETAAVTAPPLSAPVVVVSTPTTPVASVPRPTRAPRSTEGNLTTAAAAEPAPDPPAPRPRTLAEGKTYTGSVPLPGGAKIELGGIVWSETEPRALLNDRITGVVAWIEGFTVAAIEPERVALEKDGLTIFLSLK